MASHANSGKAIIETSRDSITIRVSISALPLILEGGPHSAPEPQYRIKNLRKFARELVRALNDEEEDGTTRIHKMFDDAIGFAIEQGYEGIEEIPALSKQEGK